MSTSISDTEAVGVYRPDDVVALTHAWEDMPVGQWATVLAVDPDGTCEVEFTDQEGEVLRIGRVPAAWLELLWSEED